MTNKFTGLAKALSRNKRVLLAFGLGFVVLVVVTVLV